MQVAVASTSAWKQAERKELKDSSWYPDFGNNNTSSNLDAHDRHVKIPILVCHASNYNSISQHPGSGSVISYSIAVDSILSRIVTL